MDTQGENSVIHRKAYLAREDFDAREMSPAKALRLSLAKAADGLFGLALTVSTVEQQILPQTGIQNEAGEDGLLILLDGPEGARGAVKLDIQLLAALIEVQLMGEVRQGEVEPRPVTPTDAAMTAPLIDAVLAGFNANLEQAGEGAPGLFRFGDRVEDGRTLALMLGEAQYDLYRVTADLGPGAKTGVLRLMLPHRPAPDRDAGRDGGGSLAARLEENAMNAPVTLDAVMARLRVPFNRVCDWAPGTLLPLSPDAVSAARLLASGGHVVAKVRLGQMNGFRAVRLLTQDMPSPTPEPEDQPSPDTAMPPPEPGLQVTGQMAQDWMQVTGDGHDAALDTAGADADALLPQMLGAAVNAPSDTEDPGAQDRALLDDA